MAQEAGELVYHAGQSGVDAGARCRVHSLPLVEDGSQVCPCVVACDGSMFALWKAQRTQAKSARHEPAEVALLRVEDVADVLDRRPVPVRRPGSECSWFEAFQERAKPGLMFGHGCESRGGTDLFHVWPTTCGLRVRYCH
jgi:hypothetical protein